jgi:hypothetical protein
MDLDVDTFLTTVYCVCDDLYQREVAPQYGPRPGARPKLADSEVLTLAVLAQWHPHRCERCFVRYARTHWRGYFPHLTSQSAFNRRVRYLWAALCRLGPAVAEEVSRSLGRAPAYQVWDGIPVPLMRQSRGERHRLFAAEADVGYGGTDRHAYYGMRLLASTNDLGLIEGFVVGPAATSEYWLAEALLRWRHDPLAPAPTPDELVPFLGPSHRTGGTRTGPTGPLGPRLAAGVGSDTLRPPPLLADQGFTGRRWRTHWRTAYDTTLLLKSDYAELPSPHDADRARHWISSRRQQIETIFSSLTDRFGLKFPRTRTHWGTWTRLASKVAAFNLAVFVNYLVGRPPFAIFDPLA